MPPSQWPKREIGRRYGTLIVLGQAPSTTGAEKRRRAICRCDCGREYVARLSYLRSGHTRSCGCHRLKVLARGRSLNSVHLMTLTPEHRAWLNMKHRCYAPTCRSYQSYGGRGIRVCKQWRESFDVFYRDMGPRPSRHHSIDRIDNDGHYEPGNCRWATTKEQKTNTSRVHLLTYGGETHPLAVWARRLGLHQGTLRRRIVELGWPIERAFTTSPSEYHHR